MKEYGTQIWRDYRKTAGVGHLGNPVPIDAGTVIGNGDLDPILDLLCVNVNGPGGGLSRRNAFIRWLDAVSTALTSR